MENVHSINLFLNEEFVDRLWQILKRDGIDDRRKDEVKTKLEGKLKFGLGHLWKWLASGLDFEVSTGADRTLAKDVQYTSVFRALFLSELIEAISRFNLDDRASVANLKLGSFVEVTTKMLQLIPIPTFAGVSVYSAIRDVSNSNPNLDPEKALSLAEKFSGGERAFTFVNQMDEDDSLLLRFLRQAPVEYLNLLTMSKDDHVMALAVDSLESPKALLFSVLEERYLKRNNAVFVGERPTVLFGQLGFLRASDNDAVTLIGIEPISISLA